jgi:hypothetical protein
MFHAINSQVQQRVRLIYSDDVIADPPSASFRTTACRIIEIKKNEKEEERRRGVVEAATRFYFIQFILRFDI